MCDKIMQDSWTYQEILQEGIEKGYAEGLEQGIEQGRAKALEAANQKCLASQRAFLIIVVKSCFPGLLQLATEKSQQVHDHEALIQASAQIFEAHTQAEDILTHLNETTERI